MDLNAAEIERRLGFSDCHLDFFNANDVGAKEKKNAVLFNGNISMNFSNLASFNFEKSPCNPGSTNLRWGARRGKIQNDAEASNQLKGRTVNDGLKSNVVNTGLARNPNIGSTNLESKLDSDRAESLNETVHSKNSVRPTARNKLLMRQMSGLGMEDPVFGDKADQVNKKDKKHVTLNLPKHPSLRIFDDMSLNDIAPDMRDLFSVASDPTACEERGTLDMKNFHNSLRDLNTSISDYSSSRLALNDFMARSTNRLSLKSHKEGESWEEDGLDDAYTRFSTLEKSGAKLVSKLASPSRRMMTRSHSDVSLELLHKNSVRELVSLASTVNDPEPSLAGRFGPHSSHSPEPIPKASDSSFNRPRIVNRTMSDFCKNNNNSMASMNSDFSMNIISPPVRKQPSIRTPIDDKQNSPQQQRRTRVVSTNGGGKGPHKSMSSIKEDCQASVNTFATQHSLSLEAVFGKFGTNLADENDEASLVFSMEAPSPVKGKGGLLSNQFDDSRLSTTMPLYSDMKRGSAMTSTLSPCDSKYSASSQHNNENAPVTPKTSPKDVVTMYTIDGESPTNQHECKQGTQSNLQDSKQSFTSSKIHHELNHSAGNNTHKKKCLSPSLRPKKCNTQSFSVLDVNDKLVLESAALAAKDQGNLTLSKSLSDFAFTCNDKKASGSDGDLGKGQDSGNIASFVSPKLKKDVFKVSNSGSPGENSNNSPTRLLPSVQSIFPINPFLTAEHKSDPHVADPGTDFEVTAADTLNLGEKAATCENLSPPPPPPPPMAFGTLTTPDLSDKPSQTSPEQSRGRRKVSSSSGKRNGTNTTHRSSRVVSPSGKKRSVVDGDTAAVQAVADAPKKSSKVISAGTAVESIDTAVLCDKTKKRSPSPRRSRRSSLPSSSVQVPAFDSSIDNSKKSDDCVNVPTTSTTEMGIRGLDKTKRRSSTGAGRSSSPPQRSHRTGRAASGRQSSSPPKHANGSRRSSTSSPPQAPRRRRPSKDLDSKPVDSTKALSENPISGIDDSGNKPSLPTRIQSNSFRVTRRPRRGNTRQDASASSNDLEEAKELPSLKLSIGSGSDQLKELMLRAPQRRRSVSHAGASELDKSRLRAEKKNASGPSLSKSRESRRVREGGEKSSSNDGVTDPKASSTGGARRRMSMKDKGLMPRRQTSERRRFSLSCTQINPAVGSTGAGERDEVSDKIASSVEAQE